MVSLPWLVMYLLLPACEKASKARCAPRIARASYDLLHVLAKLACETLADHSGVAESVTAPCGGIATVKKDASIQFDGAWLIFKETVDEEFVGKGLPCYEPLTTGFQLAGMLWLWSHILATCRPC